MKKRFEIKKVLSAVLFVVIFASCSSHTTNEKNNDMLGENTSLSYDSLRAAKLGADQYGMKKYVIAFLKKGPNRDLDSTKAYRLQMGHMENIGKMAEEGKYPTLFFSGNLEEASLLKEAVNKYLSL